MKNLLCFKMFIFCLFAACGKQTKNKHVEEVSINFDEIKNLDLSEEKSILLELTDSSIIKRIDELNIYDHDHYFIRSGKELLLFDKEGAFKNRLGRIGNGPAEYTHFNSFFVKNDTVYIYDAMAKKINMYDITGKHLDNKSLKDVYKHVTPNYIFPISGNKFISKNTFAGEDSKMHAYSILDENFQIISNIENRYLKDGITSLNNFYSDEHSVLFWELLNDTLYSITTDTTYKPKYFVNFHEKALPKNIKNLDLYEAIELTNKSQNRQKYASLIRSVSEDVDYLRFIFSFKDEVYYVKNNKQTNNTRTYKLNCGNRKIEPVIFFKEGKLWIPVKSFQDEDNPTLIILEDYVL